MPELISARRKTVALKIESTKGVDAAPSVAADALLLRGENIELQPLDQETVERTLTRAYFGGFEQLPAANWVRATVQLEMAGFGTAGPASPIAGYDAALRVAGLQRAVTPGVQVAYSPVSTALETATMKWNQDGRLHTMLGGVAESIRWRWAVNEIPTIELSLVGAYADTADSPFSIPDVSAYQRPLTVGAQNTAAFTLHGFAGCLQSLEITKANTVALRNLVNCNQNAHVANHAMTGAVELEGNLVADFDWYARIKAATLGALAIEHGTAAGNIVGFSAGQVQLLNPSHPENDDISHIAMDLSILPSVAGNDDGTYLVK